MRIEWNDDVQVWATEPAEPGPAGSFLADFSEVGVVVELDRRQPGRLLFLELTAPARFDTELFARPFVSQPFVAKRSWGAEILMVPDWLQDYCAAVDRSMLAPLHQIAASQALARSEIPALRVRAAALAATGATYLSAILRFLQAEATEPGEVAVDLSLLAGVCVEVLGHDCPAEVVDAAQLAAVPSSPRRVEGQLSPGARPAGRRSAPR